MKNYLKFLSTLCAVLFSVCVSDSVQASQAEADFLSDVARQYMLAQFPSQDDRKVVVKAGKVDPNRDYGGKCSGFLTAELVGGEIRKNNTVRITCSRKSNPYSIRVPVTVTVLRASTVAAENIPKGTTITANLLEDTFVSDNSNSAQVITDRKMLIGSKARRDIKAGEQIRMADFCLVAKGDVVTVIAQNSNLEIRTTGLALEEGKINDQISVKNTKSGKTIQAVVVAPNTVRVIF
ncbi:MAG: flagellar basal body P-ring formation chaperone FlgA [Succinivibrio sp.]